MSWQEAAVREYHRLFYERGLHAGHGRGLHAETRYHGIETHKCPLDLWVFQEIVWDVRPRLVIELGTYLGGTTLFLAHQLELLGDGGRVISVDIRELPRPVHSRIEYLLGDTQDDAIRNQVQSVAHGCGGAVLVIHDADHRYAPCLADLEAYGPLVTDGSYLIVEDTNVNGHPVLNDWGPGPWEAVETFLERQPAFQVDPAREKFLMTYNPRGYLRKQRVP